MNVVESGHLVITSFHGTNTEEALHRICNSFPNEAQEIARNQLASSIAVLIIQKLIYHPKARFRVPTLSILKGTAAVKGIIRDNRFAQLEGIIQTSRKDNMFTMEQYTIDYLDKLESFIHPSFNFGYSSYKDDGSYTSTIFVDKEKKNQISKPEEFIRKTQNTAKDELDYGAHYIIDDDVSMDKVLSEIYNKNK